MLKAINAVRLQRTVSTKWVGRRPWYTVDDVAKSRVQLATFNSAPTLMMEENPLVWKENFKRQISWTQKSILKARNSEKHFMVESSQTDTII